MVIFFIILTGGSGGNLALGYEPRIHLDIDRPGRRHDSSPQSFLDAGVLLNLVNSKSGIFIFYNNRSRKSKNGVKWKMNLFVEF